MPHSSFLLLFRLLSASSFCQLVVTVGGAGEWAWVISHALDAAGHTWARAISPALGAAWHAWTRTLSRTLKPTRQESARNLITPSSGCSWGRLGPNIEVRKDARKTARLECQNICRIECQKEGQKERQNRYQTHVRTGARNRMPEWMSE